MLHCFARPVLKYVMPVPKNVKSMQSTAWNIAGFAQKLAADVRKNAVPWQGLTLNGLNKLLKKPLTKREGFFLIFNSDIYSRTFFHYESTM